MSEDDVILAFAYLLLICMFALLIDAILLTITDERTIYAIALLLMMLAIALKKEE